MSSRFRFSGSAKSKNNFRRLPLSDGQSSFKSAAHRSLMYGNIVQLTKPTRSAFWNFAANLSRPKRAWMFSHVISFNG